MLDFGGEVVSELCRNYHLRTFFLSLPSVIFSCCVVAQGELNDFDIDVSKRNLPSN